jgi:hypothetical protein
MAATTKAKPPAAAKNGGPPAQRVIDLAAARVARLEAQGELVTLKWSDDITFTLPVEMPADFAILGQERDVHGAVAALIGDRTDEFFALRPSMDDLMELLQAAGKVYGMEPGESPASDGS